MQVKDVDKIADGLVKKYNTASPFELCDFLGIAVLYQDLPESVNGFFVKIMKNFAVVINSNLEDDDRRLVCAHELGHILMHSETNYISLSSRTSLSTSRYEHEADMFAVALLLNDCDALLGVDLEGLSVFEISRISHIPLELVKAKLLP